MWLTGWNCWKSVCTCSALSYMPGRLLKSAVISARTIIATSQGKEELLTLHNTKKTDEHQKWRIVCGDADSSKPAKFHVKRFLWGRGRGWVKVPTHKWRMPISLDEVTAAHFVRMTQGRIFHPCWKFRWTCSIRTMHADVGNNDALHGK